MPSAENLNPPVLLTKDHDRNPFDCGVPALNDYLKKYALQNQKRHAARTYVATGGDRIVGYYSLAYGSVSLEEATQSVRAALPRHPIPVILLAQSIIIPPKTIEISRTPSEVSRGFAMPATKLTARDKNY